MKNCLSCKINRICDFGIAVNTFKEYSEGEDGIGTVVHLTFENIEQYINCSYYSEGEIL
jgi:hypothetical protein